jgi:hypothetical protein
MATKKQAPPVAGGDDVLWQEIEPDGSENERTGRIWAPAPVVGGMSAFWVIPDGPDGEPGPGPVVLVARAGRRHLVGRLYRVRRRSLTGGMEWREVWNPTGGRFVDKGEWFREADPHSRFHRTFVPPTHAVVPHLDVTGEVALTLFATLCRKAERGEDQDYSVDAADAAAAASVASATDA